MELYDFFKSLLPLHERRIEEFINKSGIDLNEFLDFTQVQLNRYIISDNAMKNHPIIPSFLNATKTIADTRKVQAVIVKMIDRSNNEGIELKSLCLFLLNKTGFKAPGKNDTLKWEEVLSTYRFNDKFTPSSIGKTFNDLNSSRENRLALTDKHYKQATEIFKLFPDKEGLELLNSSREKKKK